MIVLTARGEIEDRVAGLDAGAVDYLVKPFSLAELVGARACAAARGRADLRHHAARSGHRSEPAHSQGAARRRDGAAVEGPSSSCSSICCATAGRCSRASRSSARYGATSTTRRRTSSMSTSAICAASSRRRDDPAPIYTVRSVGYRLGSDAAERMRCRRRLARIVPGGLRWRLAGWIAVVMLVCTGITFVAVYRGTGNAAAQPDRPGDRRRRGELAHNLTSSRRALARARLARAASSYIRDQPFSASSTLLFAIVPGARHQHQPSRAVRDSAQPDDGETPAEQVQENRLAAAAADGAAGLRHAGAARRRQPAPAQAHRARAGGLAGHDRRGRAAGERGARPERRRARVHPRGHARARRRAAGRDI